MQIVLSHLQFNFFKKIYSWTNFYNLFHNFSPLVLFTKVVTSELNYTFDNFFEVMKQVVNLQLKLDPV